MCCEIFEKDSTEIVHCHDCQCCTCFLKYAQSVNMICDVNIYMYYIR